MQTNECHVCSVCGLPVYFWQNYCSESEENEPTIYRHVECCEECSQEDEEK